MHEPIRSNFARTPGTALSRRALLGGAALLNVLPRLNAGDVGPLNPEQRRAAAFQVRLSAALAGRQLPLPTHPTNGDEQRYPNKIASFTKGLPHNGAGEVDLSAYNALLRALSTGAPNDFEAIPMGWADPNSQRKFDNPQSGLAYELRGVDSHAMAIPPAPAFASAEQAGEAVELYWMALLRDVPFTEYESSGLAEAAAADLSRLSDFRGPKAGGRVTAGTLFRGLAPGDVTGPYLSQFLLRPMYLGAQFINPQIHTVMPGVDYVTRYSEWLQLQRGGPAAPAQYDNTHRYIRNGRDLAAWVHMDVFFQVYVDAVQIMLASASVDGDGVGGMGANPNPGNPYNNSRTQSGFATFGPPYMISTVAGVANPALKAVWYQKWYVHRRLRPEVYAGRVHNQLTVPGANYQVHPEVLNSAALARVFGKNGTFLLPQAYPEGSPLHPSYGAGHATAAGACVTVLKALFDETSIVPNPVVPTADGLSLVPYDGPALTIGGELNKLAANIAMGRNFAGIHWRSDYEQSLLLGEAVAISILRDQRLTFNEAFSGYTFTRFDGTRVTV